MLVEFGEWTPDLPDFNNPGATTVKNVLPAGRSYKQLPSATAYSTNAIDARPQGAFSARDPGTLGTTYNFIGNASKLYVLSASVWTDISKAGGYATASEEDWEFAQWGEEVIATNFTDTMQTLTLGGANFADLGGTPPKARHIAVIKDFVVVGNTYDSSDGNVPNRVRWAGIGTTTSWAVSSATQADFQNLENNGGWVQKIIGGEYGLVFQERSITRMSYIGSPLIFQFDEVESNRGALASGSVIKVGNLVAYLAEDGFYMFDGQQSIPIGENRIDDYFFADVDTNYLSRMSSALYPNEQIIVWSYASTTPTTEGLNDTLLFYNYSPTATKRWSFAKVDNHLIFSALAEGYTMDGLDVITTDLDSLPFSLDSRVWAGNNNLLSCIPADLKLYNFDGTAYDAVIETGEAQVFENDRAMITKVRPVVDGTTATITMQMGERDNLSESVSWQGSVSLRDSGFAPVRSNARYHRARVNITGGFKHAQGIEVVDATKAGRR